jgi:putative hydrolase
MQEICQLTEKIRDRKGRRGKMFPCKFDLHNHTVASGHAYSTIGEIADAAQKRGLELIGIADHGPAMPGGPHLYHFGNRPAVPKRIGEMEVFFGVEANIISTDGKLDLPTSILTRLDFVAAGLHTATGYPGENKADNTKALIAAMENPYLDFIVHPGNPRFPIDVEEIALAAVRTGTALELNNSSLTICRLGSEGICITLAKRIAQLGGKIILGSDSHISSNVGNLDAALDLAQRAGLSGEQILNTSRQLLDQYLQERRRHRP